MVNHEQMLAACDDDEYWSKEFNLDREPTDNDSCTGRPVEMTAPEVSPKLET
jgi:hypothetical protein